MTRPTASSPTRSLVAVLLTLVVTLAVVAIAGWALATFASLSVEPTPTTLALLGVSAAVLAWSAVQLAARHPDRSAFDAIRHGIGIAAVVIVVDALFGTTAMGREGALRAAAVIVGIPLVELVAMRLVGGGRAAQHG